MISEAGLKKRLKSLEAKKAELDRKITETKFKLGVVSVDPCVSTNPDLMCTKCRCWKRTREMCS